MGKMPIHVQEKYSYLKITGVFPFTFRSQCALDGDCR